MHIDLGAQLFFAILTVLFWTITIGLVVYASTVNKKYTFSTGALGMLLLTGLTAIATVSTGHM